MAAIGSLYERLARLQAYYEHSAEAIRNEIRNLARAEADRVPVRGLGVTLRDAAAHQARGREADQDADRGVDRRRARGTARSVITRRMQTARALAQFDPQEPRRPETFRIPVAGLGSLVRRGYLIQKAGGYVRSAKPYRINPTAR